MREANRSWRAAVLLWGGAVALATLGATIGFDARPGINWPIWTGLAGFGLVIAARRGFVRPSPPGLTVCVMLASILALGAAVTTNGVTWGLICLGVVVLLATALRLANDVPLDKLGPTHIALAPPIQALLTVVEAGAQAGEVGRSLRGEAADRVLRGALIAVPVAAVFAWVLSGADPVFEAWRQNLVRLFEQVRVWPRLTFGCALGVCILGAYGLALRGPRPSGFSITVPMPRLGAVERAIVAWTVAGVFAVWSIAQLSYLFLDTARLEVSGMSYAEYVHRGFGELTVAATGCFLLLLALDVLADRVETAPNRVEPHVRWAMVVLVVELVGVLVSAYHRVLVYEAKYGYTTARVYVQIYVGVVAAAVLLLALELRRPTGLDVRRVIRRTAVVASLAVAGVAFANIDASVVAWNLDRYHRLGTLDAEYLAQTEMDGIPAVVGALSSLQPACADYVRRRLWSIHHYAIATAATREWYEWNLRAGRAVSAFRQAGFIQQPAAFGLEPVKDPVPACVR